MTIETETEQERIDKLLQSYHSAGVELMAAKLAAGRLEQEIMALIEENGTPEHPAAGLPSAIFECKVKVTNSYDQSLLIPLKERFTESELDKCYIPEAPGPVIPAHFNMIKTLPIAKVYGARELELIEMAKFPAKRKLEFKVK